MNKLDTWGKTPEPANRKVLSRMPSDASLLPDAYLEKESEQVYLERC